MNDRDYMREQKRLFDYQEAAEYLTVSKGTLQNWVCQRRIPVVKLGSRVRFTPDILDKFIAENTQEAIQV